MAVVFANAGTALELVVAGFVMIFFVQVAGNSMQIFASEVFPTNARASGFGWAAGVGRLATAFIMPTILWVQTGYGLTTVFVSLAILLFIAAVVCDADRVPRRGRKVSTKSPRRRADAAPICYLFGRAAECTISPRCLFAKISACRQRQRRCSHSHCSGRSRIQFSIVVVIACMAAAMSILPSAPRGMGISSVNST